MRIDVIDMHGFYHSPLGGAAALCLGSQIRKLWPDLKGRSVLGLGYATPYLPQFLGEAERVIAMMPAAQGVMHWPPAAPGLTALVDETGLPLPDACIDRVLLAHALETSEHVQPGLREIWRVLAPGGKLLIVAPNRIGLWARSEATPFGHGRPYSRHQLTQLLRDSLFSPAQWSAGLYMPPRARMLVLRPALSWERIGAICWPRFAGVLLVEAVKQIYAPLPDRARAQRLVLLPSAISPRASPRVSPRAAKTAPARQAGSPIPDSDWSS